MANLASQFAKLEQKLTACVREVAIEMVQRTEEYLHTPEFTPGAMAQKASPVLTGRYISSHRFSAGQKDLSVAPEQDEYDLYEPNIVRDMPNFKLGDTVYLTNNLPYARFLERNPSPLLKTAGKIYYTSAIAALQEMRTEGTNDACVRAARRFSAASPAKVEVNV